MYYRVLHKTRYHYSEPVSESFMEVYMEPYSEGYQQNFGFSLTTQPKAQIHKYRDYHQNWVNHFDIPQFHNTLLITAESTVQITPAPELPNALPDAAWAQIDSEIHAGDFWEMLVPSHFAQPTDLLRQLAAELNVTERHADPLTLLRELNHMLYESFDYAPNTTKVDSPIDHALAARRGVCQDFAHIMTTLVRGLHIPCRYVSGYIIPRQDSTDRSPEHASHAWVEAYLPELGWVGFDPTNNVVANERHIRVAVGRDYADVPPTKGVFKGDAKTELSVSVQIKAVDEGPIDEDLLPEQTWEEYDPTAQQLVIQLQQQQQ